MLRPTTIIEAPRLARAAGARVVLASEAFQWTGSFKARAAWNLVSRVEAREILTVSSGNFGQALAWACAAAGKRAVVLMPQTSARAKIEGVRELGGQVVLIDAAARPRSEWLAAAAAERPGARIASPFDDPLVIEGNATLGAELAAVPFDTLVVPVGGGGLAAGVIMGLEAAGRRAEIWGAEPALANDAARSLRAGRIESNAGEPMTLADGARTPSLGRHTFPILQRGLAGIVEVGELEIARALRLLFSLANVKAEPTGALALGALLADPARFAGKTVCCLVSGGNVDADLFARLLRDEPA